MHFNGYKYTYLNSRNPFCCDDISLAKQHPHAGALNRMEIPSIFKKEWIKLIKVEYCNLYFVLKKHKE